MLSPSDAELARAVTVDIGRNLDAAVHYWPARRELVGSAKLLQQLALPAKRVTVRGLHIEAQAGDAVVVVVHREGGDDLLTDSTRHRLCLCCGCLVPAISEALASHDAVCTLHAWRTVIVGHVADTGSVLRSPAVVRLPVPVPRAASTTLFWAAPATPPDPFFSEQQQHAVRHLLTTQWHGRGEKPELQECMVLTAETGLRDCSPGFFFVLERSAEDARFWPVLFEGWGDGPGVCVGGMPEQAMSHDRCARASQDVPRLPRS